MKCKNCRYNDHIKFENSTMTTCNVKLYLLKQLQKEGWIVYLTDALISQEDECYIIKAFETLNKLKLIKDK